MIIIIIINKKKKTALIFYVFSFDALAQNTLSTHTTFSCS